MGENQFSNILNISKPIAAASIAQVHLAKIKIKDKENEVAIKILRPNIEKIFNEELDALMLFCLHYRSYIKKDKKAQACGGCASFKRNHKY